MNFSGLRRATSYSQQGFKDVEAAQQLILYKENAVSQEESLDGNDSNLNALLERQAVESTREEFHTPRATSQAAPEEGIATI